MCQGHPNVVRLIEVLEDESFTYLVTELLEGGELNDRTARMSSDQLHFVFRQILDAVHFIHSKGVAHRDLKPENIVFESAISNQLRIVDFGFAKQLSDVKGMNYLEYTLDYASPEVLHCNTAGGMSTASDYWSIGAIMYRSVVGRLPFGEGDGVGERIRQANFDKEVAAWKRASLEVRQVIEGLLLATPGDRFNGVTIKNTIWYQSCIEQDDQEDVVAEVTMENVDDIAVDEEVAMLVDKVAIADELELSLSAEEEEIVNIVVEPSLSHSSVVEPEPYCMNTEASDPNEIVLDVESQNIFEIKQLNTGEEDASSIHSMSSGDAAPVDDIKTMELFNNNKKFIDEELDKPPVLMDERDRIMEEIHSDVKINFTDDKFINSNEMIEDELKFVVDNDEDFFGFEEHFTCSGRILDPYLLPENRRIRIMLRELKQEPNDSQLNTRPRSKMMRYDYPKQLGPFQIPFRKRGHSYTMITARFTSSSSKVNQPQLPMPSTEQHTTAATNLSANAAAAAWTDDSFNKRPMSRSSGRKRYAINRLADELLGTIKPKVSKLNASSTSSRVRLTTVPANVSVIAPANTSIIRIDETPKILPAESSIINPTATHCPNRRRLKRKLDQPIEDMVSHSQNLAVFANTTTRSGRRSVVPRPFVMEPFRIKVEAIH